MVIRPIRTELLIEMGGGRSIDGDLVDTILKLIVKKLRRVREPGRTITMTTVSGYKATAFKLEIPLSGVRSVSEEAEATGGRTGVPYSSTSMVRPHSSVIGESERSYFQR